MLRALLPVVVSVLSVLVACSGSEESVPPVAIDGNVTPTMVTDSVNSFVSDSGITRYRFVAPKWLMFDNAADPYWLFPEGLYMERFDDRMTVNATVTADTAYYYTSRKLWQLDGNVRMRNLQGDRFLTQQIFWDQDSRKIYNDKFIHIERPDRILEGYGFVSNQEMTVYTIHRPTGIFPTSGFSPKQSKDSSNIQSTDTQCLPK